MVIIYRKYQTLSYNTLLVLIFLIIIGPKGGQISIYNVSIGRELTPFFPLYLQLQESLQSNLSMAGTILVHKKRNLFYQPNSPTLLMQMYLLFNPWLTTHHSAHFNVLKLKMIPTISCAHPLPWLPSDIHLSFSSSKISKNTNFYYSYSDHETRHHCLDGWY
jgi:hypothetical protein